LSDHSIIVGEVKIRMVVTPYLSGLSTIIVVSVLKEERRRRKP